jgi:hypothetical protein
MIQFAKCEEGVCTLTCLGICKGQNVKKMGENMLKRRGDPDASVLCGESIN